MGDAFDEEVAALSPLPYHSPWQDAVGSVGDTPSVFDTDANSDNIEEHLSVQRRRC